MDWHGSNLRIGSSLVVWHRVISRNLGKQGNENLVVDFGLPTLLNALQVRFVVKEKISIWRFNFILCLKNACFDFFDVGYGDCMAGWFKLHWRHR